MNPIKTSLQKPFTVSARPYAPPREGTFKSSFGGGKNCASLTRAQVRGRSFGLLFSVVLILLLPSLSKAQQSVEQTITKTAQFTDPSGANNKFHALNINGSVTVEAYNGNTVKLTITEHLEGTNSEIGQAKEDLTFKLEKRGDVILAYLDAPFIDLNYDDGDIDYHVDYDSDDYSFRYDIHALVPRNILLEASTMNEGSVKINGSFKEVEARNLNGDLILKHVTSQTVATTLNGDITVVFEKTPPRDSKFKTLNGDIDITVPENLSADIYFESLRGNFYTNFQHFERLNQDGDSNNGLVKYVIGSFTPIRIGDGDVELRFDVLNGDVYLRKQ